MLSKDWKVRVDRSWRGKERLSMVAADTSTAEVPASGEAEDSNSQRARSSWERFVLVCDGWARDLPLVLGVWCSSSISPSSRAGLERTRDSVVASILSTVVSPSEFSEEVDVPAASFRSS